MTSHRPVVETCELWRAERQARRQARGMVLALALAVGLWGLIGLLVLTVTR